MPSYLKRIVLKNFQKYESSKIDFDPYVTVFTGCNDAGKSSILRAIRWVCLNKSPSRLIRKGASCVKVIIKTEKATIKRVKGDKTNTYRLNHSTYKAFGNGPPPPAIVRELGVTEENFSDQHEQPFWFSLTPGQVSKQLNQIVNLESIDKTLVRIANKRRKATTEVQVVEERLKQARQEKRELSWTVSAEEKLRSIDKQRSLHEAISNRRADLARLLHEAKVATAQATKARQRRIAAENVAETLASSITTLADLAWRSDKLRELLQDIQQTEEIKCLTRTRLKAIQEQVDAVKVCPACGRKIPTK